VHDEQNGKPEDNEDENDRRMPFGVRHACGAIAASAESYAI